MDARYTVTVKYELHHSAGEIVPSIAEVADVVERHLVPTDELNVHVSRVTVKTNEEGEPEPGTRIEGCRIYFEGLPEEWDYVYVGDRFDSTSKLRENASTVIPVGSEPEALAVYRRRQSELRTGNCMDPACPIEPKPHKEHGGRIS